MNRWSTLLLACVFAAFASAAFAQTPRGGEAARLARLKTEAIATVDASQKQVQEIVDSLFSFSELAFQEFETQRYLTELLESNGFTIETGVSGMPSSWWATWGSGEPVIALGSDIDGIPKASQMPGVAYREPLIDGAPGHGEGSQLRSSGQHRRRARRERDHAARAVAGHDRRVARCRRGAARRQGVVRP